MRNYKIIYCLTRSILKPDYTPLARAIKLTAEVGPIDSVKYVPRDAMLGGL